MITMYDATSPTNLPVVDDNSDTVALAGYCDGNYAGDWIAMVHKYPVLAAKQRIVSIASRLTTVARIMDYEPGNPCYGNPDAVAQWVLKMLAEKVQLPGGYADRADMPALQAAWVKHKVPRAETVLWLAAPGADPTPYLNQGFDAVQDLFAGKYDRSACKPTFFSPAAPPPVPTPTPPDPVRAHGKSHWVQTFDHSNGVWSQVRLPSSARYVKGAPQASAEIQISEATGHVRTHELPFDAPPLGA